MIRCCCRCVLIGLTPVLVFTGSALAAGEELARIGLAGETLRTTRRLAAADELAAQQKWTEAVDEYGRILSEAGDDLVSLDRQHALRARRVCQLRLAALPPAALQLYRNRIDSQARKWLEQGRASRDPVLLRRLVEEAFCSRYTDRALELLGDLAFEGGDFGEAERWWRMLALPASEGGGPELQGGTIPSSRASGAALRAATLLFPDPQVDVARVRAKQILARLFRGERAGLQEELGAFRRRHATARGWLAGQEGVYAEILHRLAAEQETLLAPAREQDWPTFGGNAARSQLLPRPPGRWAQLRPLDGPQWTARLDENREHAANDRESAVPVIPPFKAARALAFHPVIHGNHVFVTDGRRVLGYRLLDGRPILHYDLADHVAEEQRQSLLRRQLGSAAEPDGSYTLSIAGNRIYARLGAHGLGPSRRERTRQASPTYLVCLDLHFAVSGSVERWKVACKGTAAAGPVFEGSPVVGHGCVFLAESRFPGDQIQSAIDCYDADTGKLRWQTEVCSAPQDPLREEGKPRFRHHLVTLAGTTLFYCSHAGAIVAVDALTGQRLWGVRYSSQVPQTVFGETVPRDLAPCLHAGCRLYVAPLDSDRLFCLDPDTGRTLWERGPLQVLQLLGVAKGRLIFTTTTPRPCLRAVEATTGNDLRGWMQPADGSELKTFGRGVLAGAWVFWPIRSDLRQGVYVLDQETGEPVLFDEKINGNLAVGEGCLAVAGVRELALYVPEGHLLQQRRQEAAKPNASLRARFRLIVAEADAGLFTEALAGLDQLEAQARPEDRLEGSSLRRLLGRRRQEILFSASEQAEREKRWDQAAHFLRQAADDRFPRSARLAALSREAALWTKAAQPERAVAVWQSILDDADLGGGTILDADGTPHAAASLAAERIAALIQAHGPIVYAAVERQARSLFATAGGAARTALLDQLGRRFPHAVCAGPALLELARRHEQEGKFGAAARAYRSFLGRLSDQAERPLALAGLARAYERQNCWLAARATWQQLAAEQGERIVPALDQSRSVRALVALRLQTTKYQTAATWHRPELGLPLIRAWQAAPGPGEPASRERFVPAAGGPWRSSGNEYLFAVRAGTISCREGLTGKLCWESRLPQTVAWIGCYADVVIAAGADSMHGLSRADGSRLWSVSLATEEQGAQLAAFQLAGPRLFCLQEERRLLALDVFSGRVLWSAWAPAGRFQLPPPSGRFRANYHAGEESIVIQTGMGQWLVFDSRTGRRLGEPHRADQPWPWPPLPLDERRLCVWTDPEHLTVLDATTGREIWTYSVDSPVSLTGEPLQILGHRDTLLLLIGRNYGYYLECVDSRNGSRRWSKPCYVGTQAIELEGAALDETAVYLVRENALLAYALADGRLLWQRKLPASAGCWRTLRLQNCLLAVPREGRTIQWQLRWLFVTACLHLALPPAANSRDCLCLVACDPQTGRPLQCLRFPAGLARAACSCRLQPLPVLAPQFSRCFLPPEETALAVQVSGQGLIVQADGKAWSLKTYRDSATVN